MFTVPWLIEGMGLHGTMLKEVPWPIEVMEPHGTLLEGVPWPIEGMGLHGTLLEGVLWPIEGMGLHGTASYAHVVTHFSDIGSRHGMNITGTLVVRASCQYYRQFSACF